MNKKVVFSDNMVEFEVLPGKELVFFWTTNFIEVLQLEQDPNTDIAYFKLPS